MCFLTNTLVPYPNCWETKQSNLSTKPYKTKTYIKKKNKTTKGHLLYSIEKSKFPLCMKVVNMSIQFSHKGKKANLR